MIDKNSLAQDLMDLGIRKGDCVMLHSSLSALGFVEGGSDAVVDAIMQTLGPDGTLVTPAFTRGAWYDRLAMEDCNMDCVGETCPSQSPSNEGAIPNAVLKREGRIRGCHPTHSWVAYGKHAYDICKDTYKCQTLCGKGTVFEKVVELGGCIVTLGVMVNHRYVLALPRRRSRAAVPRTLSRSRAASVILHRRHAHTVRVPRRYSGGRKSSRRSKGKQSWKEQIWHNACT